VHSVVAGEEVLAAIFDWLTASGHTVIGPTARDGVIVHAVLEGPGDLPVGWTDAQQPGSYRLERGVGGVFDYAVPGDSWKRYLQPPVVDVLHIRRSDGSLAFAEPAAPVPRMAFFGVRACDLAAIAIQDRVFVDGDVVDTTYHRRRTTTFVVAVNCARPAATCFCVSMGTGPRCQTGYDVVLTELREAGSPEYLVESGSRRGEMLVQAVQGRSPEEADLAMRDAVVARAAAAQSRAMPDVAARRRLSSARDHPRWAEIAERCLACANCTMVCPTCFCSTTEDRMSLDGETAVRARRWDSCFTLDFTSVHGTPVRASVASRYRQWLTHKLDAWHDQFGMSGCVGCGRCITWCPVGIDLTEEVVAVVREGSEM
jgi:sulfhydrogenase subunit beta (sulfur reductase)